MSEKPVAQMDAYSEGFDDAMQRLQEYVEQARALAIAEAARLVDHILREGGGTYGDAIRALSSPPSVSEEYLELKRQRDAAVEALKSIADAKPQTWEADMRDQFQPWAQSRANAVLREIEGGA